MLACPDRRITDLQDYHIGEAIYRSSMPGNGVYVGKCLYEFCLFMGSEYYVRK